MSTARNAAATAVALGLVLAAAAPALADTATTSGTTTGGPTYNRRQVGIPCGAASGVGTAVHYATVPLSVSTAGSYTVTSSTITPTSVYDGFLFLYSAPFDPTAPAARCHGGSDDLGSDLTSSSLSLPLTAGTAYTIVQTGFANTDAGPFTLPVNGPGTVIIQRYDGVQQDWNFVKRVHVRIVNGHASTSYLPPAVGRYRATGSFDGSRGASPSKGGFATVLVAGPLVERR